MILSPAWETELSLLPSNTIIDDRDSLIVVRSEEFPEHIWKNFILFDELPQGECISELMCLYRSEFPLREFSVAFGWNRAQLAKKYAADFRRHGFAFTRDLVLTASPIETGKVMHDIKCVRECKTDTDWDTVLTRRIEFLCSEPFKNQKIQFEIDKFAIYRSLVDARRGHWFIASMAGQDVADVGIFYSQKNRASIDELLVYPEFRKRGVGTATIRAVCHLASVKRFPESFITVAGQDYFSKRLCASSGFSKAGFIERCQWHKFMKRKLF